MTTLTLVGAATILSTMLATPVLAQALIQEPGSQTTTRPWSAPVGHRQPRTADVPASTSASRQILDQEDARVDRSIRSVCRGC